MKQMGCTVQTENPDILLDYCSCRLSSELKEVVEQHLAACTECRNLTDGQTAIWNALENWEAEPVSSGFDRTLYRRLETSRPSLAGWWNRFTEWTPALPVAAGALALLLVLAAPRPQAPAHPTALAIPAEHTLEPEQVERTLEDLEMLKQLGGTVQPSRRAL